MSKTQQKIIISWTLICFISGLSGISQIQPANAETGDISNLLSQVGTSTNVGEKTLFDAIAENDINNISPGFKSWVKDLKQMHEEMKNRANEEIKKADSLEETIEIAEMNNEILDKINARIDSTTNTNELAYLDALQKHYTYLKSDLKQLGVFNEAYEFLVIMSGGDLDIAGTTKDNKTLRQEYEAKSQESQSTTSLEPQQTSDTYTGEEPPGGYTAYDLPIYNAVNTTANYICQLYPTAPKAHAQDNAPGDDYNPDADTTDRRRRPSADANPDREEELPPELVFTDPTEQSIFLPQTYEEAIEHINNGDAVDPRVYFFVYHILQQMRAGQDESGTAGEDYIQEASTPTAVELICKGEYEDNPETCDGPQLQCGLSQTAYALQWLFGRVDNMGSIFGDRTHMEIWIGLNSPTISDEYNQEEGEGTARSAHKDFKAIDVSAVGLYNERLDCAACKGLEACTPDCLLLETPTAQCCPIIPLPLDNAADALVPVEVQWSHEDIKDDLLAGAADGLMDSIIDPDIINNGSHIKSLLGLMSKNAFNQIIGGDLKNFDFFQLANGTFEDFMFQSGNSLLQENIFGQLGFPEDFLTTLNWNDPKSFFTNMASGYLGEAFGLPGNMMTPLLSAAMSGDFKDAALAALNMSSNLDIPANIRNYMDIAIQNADNPKAIGLAFANIGTGQINNIMGWPEGTLDINDLSGQGFEAIANRLTGYGLSKVSGLPSDFIVDINNPQNTLSSLSGSLLSKSIGNYEISNFITQSIASGQTPTLNSVLKQFSPEDISSLLNLSDDQIGIANQIYEHVQNPTDHIVFLNTINEQIDLVQLSSQNPYLNESALKTILQEGTSPDLGDEKALTNLATQILFDRAGVNISQTDLEKTSYLADLNKIINELPPTPPGFNSLNPIIGGIAFNPNQAITTSFEYNNLNNQFIQEFGATESLIQFQERINQTINESESGLETIRDLENYTAPIFVRFTNTTTRNEFLLNLNDPNSRETYDYIDTVQLPTRGPDNNTTYIPTNNILKSVGIDINKVNIVPLETNQNSANQLAPTNTNQSVSGSLPITNINPYENNTATHMIYPKINLADMLIPGNEDSTNSEIGKFRLLESLTDVINYSFDKPIEIAIYPTGDTPATPNYLNSSIPQNNSAAFNLTNPNSSTTNPNLNNPNDPLRLAMNNKFSLPYLNPVGGYNSQPIDLLTNFGSTPAIYDAISQIGVDNNQAESLFTNIGQLQTASNLTGVNAISSIVSGFGEENSTDTVSDLGNTMGLLAGMQSGDVATGVNTAVGFMEQYQILEKVAPTSWDIDSEGNLTSQIADVTSIYGDLKGGNYVNTLENIPGIKNKFTDFANLGFDPKNLFSTLNNPTPDNISRFAIDFASTHISAYYGLDRTQTMIEFANVFNGFPPDASQIPSQLPQLLQSDYFKNNILKDVDPQLLGDASDIFSLIQSGGNPKDIIQKFGTMQMFKNMVGSDKYTNFLNDYGGFVDAALSGDPKAIAQSFMNKYSADINGWLGNQGLGDIMDIGTIQGLINGDIKSFAKNTATKYATQIFASDANFGQYSGLVDSVFNGKVPYKQIADIVIGKFFSPSSDILCSTSTNSSASDDNCDHHSMISCHKQNKKPSAEQLEKNKKALEDQEWGNKFSNYLMYGQLITFKSIIDAIDDINMFDNAHAAPFGFGGPGSLCGDTPLAFGGLKLQMTNMLKNMVIQKLTSLFSDVIFKKCKQKIASDNIIHFMDIALDYYKNPLARNYFLVDEQEKEEGKRVAVEELEGLRRFHPFQIFSDFTEEIFGKIEDKSQQVFEDVWYTSRIGRINVFEQTCHERENDYLKDCEEFIHFGW